MFESKKAADAHDKMLELAEQFTALLEKNIPGVDESAAENFGLLLAKNSDKVAAACKGKSEVLMEIGVESAADEETGNVTPLSEVSNA